VPLFSTLIALLEDGEPVLGLIDLPALSERYVGWKGGGCRRNGQPTRVSTETDLQKAIISHGDPYAFELYGKRDAYEKMGGVDFDERWPEVSPIRLAQQQQAQQEAAAAQQQQIQAPQQPLNGGVVQ